MCCLRKILSLLIVGVAIAPLFHIGTYMFTAAGTVQRNNIEVIFSHLASEITTGAILCVYASIFNNNSFVFAFSGLNMAYKVIYFRTLHNDQNYRITFLTAVVVIWGLRSSLNWCLFRWSGFPSQNWQGNYIETSFKCRTLGWIVKNPIFIIGGNSVLNALNLHIVAGNFHFDPMQMTREEFSYMAMVVLGLLISFMSDYELNCYRAVFGSERISTCGLRRIIRNPKFLGELTFWWGIYLYSTTGQYGTGFPYGPILLSIFMFLNSIISGFYNQSRFAKYQIDRKNVSLLRLLPL